MDWVAEVDPAGQVYPALHTPGHAAAVLPGVADHRPASQGLQDPQPAELYCPAGQMDWVAEVEPYQQAYPALHTPGHAAAVLPGVADHRPASQGLQEAEPAALYCPAGQMDWVAEVDPAGQMYPA
jgi:hypothetical protein